jgi:superfamily II helicase
VNEINALPYHAGLDAKSRVNHQDRFLKDDCDIIVATIAFGMGIDKPDVRLLSIMTFQKVLKVIIKRPVGQDEMEERDIV